VLVTGDGAAQCGALSPRFACAAGRLTGRLTGWLAGCATRLTDTDDSEVTLNVGLVEPSAFEGGNLRFSHHRGTKVSPTARPVGGGGGGGGWLAGVHTRRALPDEHTTQRHTTNAAAARARRPHGGDRYRCIASCVDSQSSWLGLGWAGRTRGWSSPSSTGRASGLGSSTSGATCTKSCPSPRASATSTSCGRAPQGCARLSALGAARSLPPHPASQRPRTPSRLDRASIMLSVSHQLVAACRLCVPVVTRCCHRSCWQNYRQGKDLRECICGPAWN
jgi:hypothetical protein